jgi:Ca2+-binding RTX toxin-like protein
MKRVATIAISTLALAACAAAPAGAAPAKVNVLLAGGSEANTISIGLSPDGQSYVIDSIVELEAGGSVCTHPTGIPNQLICQASAIGSFEVNAGGGDDTVTVARDVPVPATLRGGPGDDQLTGGAGDDRLLGGIGNDRLVGRDGADSLFGGPGDDTLSGCGGDDVLIGGPGVDLLKPGTGSNIARQ